MSVLAHIRVLADQDGQPINGARVFVNGARSGTTDASGIAAVTFPSAGTYRLDVNADGYVAKGFDQSIGNGLDVLFHLKAEASVPVLATFFFYPANPGIVWNLRDEDSNDIESGVSDSSGSSTLLSPVDPGIYSLEVTAEGYGTVFHTLEISPQAEFEITLVKENDSGVSNVPEEDTEPLDLEPPIAVREPDRPETIYPNSSFSKYFTATLARIYIGNLFIDEANTCQFVLQENTLPVYGYSSRFADAYAAGRSLVQGQLAINFVLSGYLKTVLTEYSRLFGRKVDRDLPPEELEARELLLARGTRRAIQGSRQDSNSVSALQRLDQHISSLMLNLSPAAVSIVRETERQQLREVLPVRDYSDNPVYLPVAFDLQVELGEGVNKSVRQLEKCKLISNEQIYDQSGSPVLDVYGFIARRLR